MAGNVEVHDRIVAQLQQRNCQLLQEKAEVELRLRQAMALLSELQSVWLDLPDEVTASISKVLTKHSCNNFGNLTSRTNSGGTDGTDSVKSCYVGAGKSEVEIASSRRSSEPISRPALNKINKSEQAKKNKQPAWQWLPFDINLGCTPDTREKEEEEQDSRQRGRPPMPLSTQMTPQRQQAAKAAKDPSPSPCPSLSTEASVSGSMASPDAKAMANPNPKKTANAEARRSRSPEATTTTETPWAPPSTMGNVTEICITDTIDTKLMPMNESALSNPPSPLGKLNLPPLELSVCRDAVEVSDLICDVPGASTLLAEIDVLCGSLQSSIEQSHADLEQRIEALRGDLCIHKQHLDDTYSHKLEAQSADLALCKAQLSEAYTGSIPLGSPRVPDCYEKAGQAHVAWLDECIKQRIEASETFIAAKRREFAQDLQAMWERKALLTARIRAQFTNTMFSSRKEDVASREIAQMRKSLQDLEAGSLGPLRQLAVMYGKESSAQIAKLESIKSDSMTQVKATALQLNDLVSQCKTELKMHNAVQNSNEHLRRRALLTDAFSIWVAHRVEAQLTAKDRELLAKDLAGLEMEEQYEATTASQASTEQKLERAQAVRTAAIHIIQAGTETKPYVLALCFGCWESHRLKARLTSTTTAEQRLQRMLDCGSSAMCFMQAGLEHQGLLVKAFMCWEGQHIASQLTQKDDEAKALALRFEDSHAARTKIEERMKCLASSRSALVGFLQSGMQRYCVLTVAFARWLAGQLSAQLSSKRQLLADQSSEFSSIGEECRVAKAGQAEALRKLRRHIAGAGKATCDLHEGLERRYILVRAFGQWMVLRLEGRAASQEEQLGTWKAELKSFRAEAVIAEAAREGAERQLGFAMDSRSSALHKLHTVMERRFLLVTAFCTWCSRELESRADSMRQELAKAYSNNVNLDSELRAARSHSEGREQILREQSVRGAHALLATTARRADRASLAQAFSLWSAKRLETQIRTAVEELDVKGTLEKQLHATRSAVTMVQKRCMRQGLLLLAWHSWAAWRLRQAAQQSSFRLEEQKARVSSQMAELRAKAIELFDEYAGVDSFEDVSDRPAKATMRAKAKRSNSLRSSSYSDTD